MSYDTPRMPRPTIKGSPLALRTTCETIENGVAYIDLIYSSEFEFNSSPPCHLPARVAVLNRSGNL